MSVLSAEYKGYIIFSDSKIIGLKKTVLKPGLTSVGYYSVVICTPPFKKTELVHRIVATCFIPNPDNKRVVNHKNGIKTDNRLENLEWATDKENINHAFQSGLCSKTIQSIRERMQKTVINTTTGETYPSATAAAKATGINENSLRTMLTGHRPNKTNLKYSN